VKERSSEPKRQERGKLRMESLLKAAEDVFAEVGFERATTNLIAARAEVSPGSLYQFYPNKEAMAEAIASRYSSQLERLHQHMFEPGRRSSGSLARLIDATVDPFLEFHRLAPAFEPIFMAAAASEESASRVRVLHDTVAQRLESVLAAYVRGASAEQLHWAAEVAVCVFRGFLPLIGSTKGKSRTRAISELKLVLSRYLAPMVAASR